MSDLFQLMFLLCSCPVEELGLDFTLPGYPNIELRKGGREMTVTSFLFSNDISLILFVVKGELGKFGFLRFSRLALAAGGRCLHSDGGCQVDFIQIYSPRNLNWFSGKIRVAKDTYKTLLGGQARLFAYF